MAASSPSPPPLPPAFEKPRRPRFSEGPCNTTAPNFDFALDPYEEAKHAAFVPDGADQLATQPTWTTTGSHDARGPGRQEAPPRLPRRKAGFGTTLADFAAIVPPVALLAFAAVLLARDGNEVSQETYGRWKNAATVLSTLFPLLFAAIVGRFMLQAARWKLEEGATLGALEQLLGSRTVGGAILTQFQLRDFNLLGLALMLLWVFSPLGSQAILRMVESRLATLTESSTPVYFDTNARSIFAGMETHTPNSFTSSNNVLDLLATMYSALILTPLAIKDDAADLWGNVKVPLFSSHGSESTTEWQEVPSGSDYSALVGLPILDLATGNTTFNMESSYIELQCEDIVAMSGSEWEGQDLVNSTALEGAWDDSPPVLPNGTFQGYSTDRNSSRVEGGAPFSISVDRLVDPLWSNSTWLYSHMFEDESWEYQERLSNCPALFNDEADIEAEPTALLFQAALFTQVFDQGDYIVSHCGIKQKYVESRVTCSKTGSERHNCSISAQRPSQRDHPPENISHLSFPQVMRFVSAYMPLASGDSYGSVSNTDLTLQFLADPALTNLTQPQGDGSPPLQLGDLNKETLSLRLTQALNSYLHISQMYTDALSNRAGNATTAAPALRQNATSSGDVSHLVLVYHIPKAWAILCLVSCAVLLAGGVLSAVFAHMAVGPEVLSFASTVLRDSRLIAVPPAAGGMDGMALTREMKRRRVRYGISRREGVGIGELLIGGQDQVGRIRDVK